MRRVSASRRGKRIAQATILLALFLGSISLTSIVPNRVEGAPAGKYFDHVVTILMENQGVCQVLTTCGGPATYQTQLAQNWSIAYSPLTAAGSGYTGITHPSEGNYVGMIGGNTYGMTSDCGYCPWRSSAQQIIDIIEPQGLTYSLFAEDSSGSGTCSFNPPRGGDHFAFISFSDMNTASRCSHFLTTSGSDDHEFLAALNAPNPSNFVWLTPNDCNNAHDCGEGTGDPYLATLVPQILSSNMFKTSRSALFIVYDESYGGASQCGECVYATWAGGSVKKAYSSATSYDHYSWLATIENNFMGSTGQLGQNDVSATPMSEFFIGSSSNPQPSFTYTPSNPQTGQTVTFTGTVSGGTSPYSYSWNFGDGSTVAGSSSNHSFSTAGSYTVTLNVNDTAKKTGSTSQTVSVTQPPTPDFTISANPSSLTVQNGTSAPSTITISSTGGFSGSVSITASTVSGISTSFNPSSLSPPAGGSASSTLTFSAASSASAGTYSFTITGASGSISHPIPVSVIVTSQPPLSSSFTYSPSNPQTGQTVTFTGAVSGGTPPYSYSWNFGDGSTGTGNSPTYVYNTAGSYSVALNVQDSTSKIGRTGQTVTVTQAPTQDFTINANPSGLTVQAGNSKSSTITVTPVNGFSNDVGLTVSFSSSGPSGSFNPATILGGSGTSTLTISTTSSTNAGSYQVTVIGSSPTVTKSVILTLTVTTTQNNPPVVTVLGPLTAATGSAVTLKASASDPDPGETIVLGASGLPSGATFDANTGLFSWTPASNQVGSYTITFTATDNGTPPLTSSQPVTLQITTPASGGCGNNCSSFPIPSTGIWLVGLGGLFSLVLSLVVLNVRSRSRLRQARNLNRLED